MRGNERVGGQDRQGGDKRSNKNRNSIIDGVASMVHHLFYLPIS